MFNFSFSVYPSGLCRVTYFKNHLVSHQAPKSKKRHIPTPFTDNDTGETLYATKIEYLSSDPEFLRKEAQRTSISRTKKHIRDIALSGNFKYFCTFTFSPDTVNRYDYDETSKCMRMFLASIRKLYPTLQYIVIPELHKDGAFHFHGLFSSELPVKYAGFYAKSGGHVYHVSDYFYGYTTSTVIKDACAIANYVVKYISKDLVAVSKGRRRYWWSYKTIKVVEPQRHIVHPIDAMEIFDFIKTQLGGSVYVPDNVPFETYISTFLISYLYPFLDYVNGVVDFIPDNPCSCKT